MSDEVNIKINLAAGSDDTAKPPPASATESGEKAAPKRSAAEERRLRMEAREAAKRERRIAEAESAAASSEGRVADKHERAADKLVEAADKLSGEAGRRQRGTAQPKPPPHLDDKYEQAPRWRSAREALKDPGETTTIGPDLTGRAPKPGYGPSGQLSVGQTLQETRRRLAKGIFGSSAPGRLAKRASDLMRDWRTASYEKRRGENENRNRGYMRAQRNVFRGVARGAAEVVDALVGLRDGLLKTAKQLNDYSPTLAQETAIQDAKNLMMDVRQAQQYGDQLSHVVRNQAEMNRAFTSLGRQIADAFAPWAETILNTLELIANTTHFVVWLLTPIIKPIGAAANEVVEFINYWMGKETSQGDWAKDQSGPIKAFELWLAGRGPFPRGQFDKEGRPVPKTREKDIFDHVAAPVRGAGRIITDKWDAMWAGDKPQP